MKRTIFAIVALLLVASGASAHNPKAWRKMKQSIDILWTSDLDKGGCYDQKVIAASKRRLSVNMIDKNGNLLHTVNKCK